MALDFSRPKGSLGGDKPVKVKMEVGGEETTSSTTTSVEWI